jgi:spore coat polysaccharide biosynthesis protein SpsF
MAVAVIQARMGSTRLPGKVLLPLGEGTVLSWVVRAAQVADAIDEVVVATTEEGEDDAIAMAASALGCRVVRGSVDDVLDRYLVATADDPGARTLVRLTSDCPLLDPDLISAAVRAFEACDVDYLSTTVHRSLPRGLDVEVTTVGALRWAAEDATAIDRVHVTPRLYRDPAHDPVGALVFLPDASDLRVTIDEGEDADLVERIVAELGDRPPRWREVVDLLRSRPDLVRINARVEQKAIDAG